MPRGLSTALQNEIANQSIKPIALVTIKFNEEERFTNHYKTIVLADSWDDDLGYWDSRDGLWDDGETYEASGHILKISAKTESSSLNVNNFSIRLSAVESTFTAILLDSDNPVSNKDVAIDIGFLDSNDQLIDVFNYAKGFIDSFTIDTKTAIITINCTSHFGDFSRVAGRKTNEGSHGKFFENDKESFEFSAEAIKDLKWGRI